MSGVDDTWLSVETVLPERVPTASDKLKVAVAGLVQMIAVLVVVCIPPIVFVVWGWAW